MLSSWVFFARRHVNLPPMRGEAPIQLRETVADHTKKRERTEAALKSSSRNGDRVSMSNPFHKKVHFKHKRVPLALEKIKEPKTS